MSSTGQAVGYSAERGGLCGCPVPHAAQRGGLRAVMLRLQRGASSCITAGCSTSFFFFFFNSKIFIQVEANFYLPSACEHGCDGENTNLRSLYIFRNDFIAKPAAIPFSLR